MAYQPMFSTGGGFNAMNLYESEEERRRRLQEEAIARGELPAGPVAPAEPGPVKQTITYDPVTGEQRMKIEGSVTDLSAANPLTPTVAMPNAQVPAPNATMPIAGPMAPGAGPTPEELMRDEEQRRQYELMMARPVAPEQPPVQLAAAPAATMTDVTAPTTGAVAPTAMPRTMPTAEDRQYEAQGLQEGPIVREAAMAWGNIANVNRNNPAKLLELAQDPGMPENWRKVYAGIAGDAGRQTKNQETGEARGQQAMQTGRTDRILQREVEPGSVGFYAKMYLLRALGFEDKYQDEMRKTKTTFQQVVGDDNRPYTVEVRGDGLAVRGYNQEGQPVDDKTLTALSAQTSVLKGAQTSARRVRDQAGTEWSVVQTPQGPIFYDNQRRRGTPQGKTIDIGIGSDLDLTYNKEMISARAKLETLKASERIKTWEGLNAIRAKEGKPLFSLGDLGLDASGEFTTRAAQPTQAISPQFGGPAAAPAAAPAAPAARPVAPAAPAAPAARPSAPSVTPTAPTTGQIERTAAAQAEIVKKAAEVVASAPQIISDINSGNTALNILENKKTNFGSILQGQIPGEQAVGRFFGTDEARDTQTVMEVVDKVTASGAKALGANPTDRDLAFLLQNRPNESWPPTSVADWIRRVQERSRTALDVAKKQVESGGTFVPEAPASVPPRSQGGPTKNQERTIDGVTYVFDGKGWKRK